MPTPVRAFTLACLIPLLLDASACGSSSSGSSAGGAGGGAGSGTGGSAASGGSSGTGATGGGTGGSGAVGPAPVGEACSSDADCVAGMRCLVPLFAGTDGYCANTCSVIDDCNDLESSSYLITVPDSYTPIAGSPTANAWNTPYLGRGTACGPIGNVEGEPSYCQFVCPDLSAAALENGQIAGCTCLPGYTLNATQNGCELDTSVQCSIFSYATPQQRDELTNVHGIQVVAPTCDACNSDLSFADTADCHTSRFMCVFGNSLLNGACAEVFTGQEFLDCAAASIYTSCDCNCPTPDACGPDAYAGWDCACCTCTANASKPPRPVCTGAGGTGGTSGSGGTGAAGGTGGTGGTSGSGGTGAAGSGGTGAAGSGGTGAGGSGGTGAAGSGGTGAGGSGGTGAGGSGAGAGADADAP